MATTQEISGTSLVAIQGVEAAVRGGAPDEKTYYDYNYAKGVYDKLIGGWSQIVAETERQRDLRYVKDADSDSLRKSGLIAPDALYTPARLIDTNIRTEQPSYIRYITQSRRSIIFASEDGQTVDGLEKLEDDFTKRARYDKWEVPFIRMVDGGQAHGWDGLEILFDENKPGNFCFEHIGHDRLIFSVDCEDVEAQEVIAIKKMLTAKQLRTMVADGFNQAQVDKLVSTNQKDLGNSDCINEVYEVFFKLDGVVHVAWYARPCDGYLKEPTKLFMGRRDFTAAPLMPEVDPLTQQAPPADYPPIFETEYPVVVYKYIESNDPRIVEICGRVKLDEAAQEGASALQSSFVNKALRSSKVYGSPANSNINSDPNALPILTDVVLAGDRLISQPINWWSLPSPDESTLKGMQMLVLQNKQEQSRPDFAATNRKDSGKTATEMNLVAEQKNELSSVQVILLSITIREAYAKGWKIFQNRVLQGKIIIKDPVLLNLFGEGIEVDQATMRVASCQKAKYYLVKSSGDVDVVQRDQKLQRLMQGWEVFGKTPLAMEYLKDIIRYAFPEDAARYISVLEQAQMNEVAQLKGLLQQTSAVLQAAVTDPATGDIKPEAKPHQDKLIMLAQQVQAALSSGGATGMDGGQQAAA
jgi:hypothetical protein